MTIVLLFLYIFPSHRDLNSFPTRRSSDLELNDEPSDYPEEARAIVEAVVDERVKSIRAVGCPGAAHDHGHRAATRRERDEDRKSTRLNSSHTVISYAVSCLKK